METTKTKRIFINILLALGGIAFSGVLIMFMLSLFPQFRPDMIVFSVKMGDIFYNHADWVKRPENPDEVLSIHRLVWDEDGFRVPARVADSYDVIALGDSYTEAANVALPWSDVVAESSGLSVRNLGFRGYGPVEEAYILEKFGQEADSRIIIVGFFEGNDLDNVVSAQGKEIILPSEAESFEIIPTDLDVIDQSGVRYPMTVVIGDIEHPIAFFEWYVWNLNAPTNVLQRSTNLQLLRNELERMRTLSRDKCLIVAYFPSKPHIYVPYLVPASQDVLMANSHQRELDENGALVTRMQPSLTFERLIDRLGNQRDVIQAMIEELDIRFFDTTPVLQQAAAEGGMLYYTYDTHWNQEGHNVVGEAIADYVADACSS